MQRAEAPAPIHPNSENRSSVPNSHTILDRLTATVFPDSARETYTYTLDGLLKTRTDRKLQTITYAYDGLKRLKTKSYPNAQQIRYLYTGQSLIEVQDDTTSPPEVHLYAYDDAYRRISDTQGTRGVITYAYTPSDAVASYSVQGGPTATYSYYPDGSLNTIQWAPVTGQFKYSYTQNGQYQTITFPNGQSRNYSYDDQGRLVTLGNQQPAAGNLATYDYAYDLNHLTGQNTMLGQRVSLTATVPSQGLSAALTKYSYDAGYQLSRAEYPTPTPFNGEVHSWTYDAIGNRLSSTVNAATASYDYQKIGTNPNNWQRLLSDGVSGYTYDANGNTATKTGLTFGSDAENRLTSIDGTTTASYRYDYQGRRSGKTFGTATSYLYDGLNLLRETAASPVDYLFGPGIDEPIAVSEGGAVHYPLVDGLGSVAGLASSGGVVANQYSYDAWGVTKSQSGTATNSFGYTSREFGEAGLSFYRARFYNQGSGRFLSEDPISIGTPRGYIVGSASGTSEPVYAYALNDPIRYDDATGQAVRVCCRIIRGAFGAQHCYIQRNATDTWGVHPTETSNGKMAVPYHNNSRDGGGTCGPWSNGDACVLKYAKSHPRYDYKTTGPNSNTYAHCIADLCKLGAPAIANELDSPGWDSPRQWDECKGKDCEH